MLFKAGGAWGGARVNVPRPNSTASAEAPSPGSTLVGFFRPRVAERGRAVEHRPAGHRVGRVGEEVAEPLELIVAARPGAAQGRLDLRRGDHFQRIGIEIVEPGAGRRSRVKSRESRARFLRHLTLVPRP